MIRLIAVDLDDTLLQTNKNICADGAAMLREAAQKGICVVLATSRRLASVQQIATGIGIVNQPVICADGALIMSHSYGDIWQAYTIPNQIAAFIAQHADANNWELTVVGGNKTYYRQRPGQTLGHLKDDYYVVESNSAMVRDAEPMRILAHDAAAIQGLSAFLDAENYTDQLTVQYYYHSDNTVKSIGIFPQFSDKGTALSHVCERLNIPLEHTLALGDGSNDIPMFQVAGKSVVMANARDEVKQYADFITASNDNAGVAEAVRKYAL